MPALRAAGGGGGGGDGGALGAFLTDDHVPDGERPHWLRIVARFAGACRQRARKALDLPS